MSKGETGGFVFVDARLPIREYVAFSHELGSDTYQTWSPSAQIFMVGLPYQLDFSLQDLQCVGKVTEQVTYPTEGSKLEA
jgi:hypothetical protein